MTRDTEREEEDRKTKERPGDEEEDRWTKKKNGKEIVREFLANRPLIKWELLYFVKKSERMSETLNLEDRTNII